MDSQLFAFTTVVALLTITPGADTMLVLRSVIAQGQRSAFFTIGGITAGLFIHALLSAVGLSFILIQSSVAFTVIKWVGAAYLVFLGVQSLIRLRHYEEESSAPASPTTIPSSFWQPLLNGLVTNVFNPKVAIFYLAFLPQFIHAGEPPLAKSLLLAGIHGLFTMGWLCLVALFIHKVRPLLLNPTIRRRLEALTGLVLIGFGIRLAMEER